MKKQFTLLAGIFLLFIFSNPVSAQCTGGRYHDLVFPSNPTVSSDITYGSNLDQNGVMQTLKLDVYQPACDTARRRPLIVFAHGGSFVSGDKADASYAAVAVSLAKLGYVVASINYRLGFPTTPPAGIYGFNSAIVRAVHDARAAVRFLRNDALNGNNTYGIDPNTIYFGGVSAGGIMALHLAYQNLQNEQTMPCNNQPGTEQSSIEGTTNTLNVSSSVDAIISISGGIRDLSWITNNDIPVCLAHGTADGTVPYGSGSFGGFFAVEGSSTIATRCSATNTQYCFKPMIGQDHTPSNPNYADTVAVLMRNFLEKFTCNTTLNCAYTGSAAVLSPAIAIAVTSGANPTCTGQSVTFTATASNAGPNFSYQWKRNGNNVATGATYTSSSLANNDAITCVLTTCSSVTTVTSNTITMSVTGSSAPTATISLTAGSNPTCPGASLTFTATSTNGGTSPGYQWKVNGNNVATGTTFTSAALTNGNTVSCVVTSNSACASPTTATSNTITITTSTAVTPSVSIALTSGSNPTCAGASLTFTATPSNGGSAPTYQWKVNGNNVATGSTFTSTTLTNSNAVSCVLTSNSACANPTTATSNSITISTSTSVAPSVSIAVTTGSNPSCTGAAVTFTATPTNGGATPAYQWKNNGNNVGTGSMFTSSSLTNGDVITCVMTSNSACASTPTATSNSITMSVTATVAPTVAIAVTGGANPTCAGSSVTLTATGSNGGTAPVYQWKKNGVNASTGSNFTSAALANNDTVTCVLTSNSSCASPSTATSAATVIKVNAVPVVTKAGNVLTSSATQGNQWYAGAQPISGATNRTYTVTTSGNYSVKANGCISQALTVTITALNDLSEADMDFRLYPNPNTGVFTIDFNALAGETYTLNITTVTGAVVHNQIIAGVNGYYKKQIDVSQLAKGVYLVSITNNYGTTVKRIELQ